MSGTNPDGSDDDDSGIRYISYFNGGDAIHAFNRASFSTPRASVASSSHSPPPPRPGHTPRSPRSSRSRTEQAQDIGDPQLTRNVG
jgi:hypothetical protein